MAVPPQDRAQHAYPDGSIDRYVGRRIAGVLHARGLSQRAAAVAVGMAHRTFCRTLAGARSFRIEELVAVADFAGIDLTDVLRSGHHDNAVRKPGGKR